MKVVCMTHENFSNIPYDRSVPRPDIGDTVTVVGERKFCGIDCFMFAEYICPNPMWEWMYDKRNFSPLSNIDETELVNEKEAAFGILR